MTKKKRHPSIKTVIKFYEDIRVINGENRIKERITLYTDSSWREGTFFVSRLKWLSEEDGEDTGVPVNMNWEDNIASGAIHDNVNEAIEDFEYKVNDYKKENGLA